MASKAPGSSAPFCNSLQFSAHRSGPVVPTVAALTEGTYSRNQAYLADLMDKKLSWGGYISGVVGNYRKLSPKVAAELQRIRNSLTQ